MVTSGSGTASTLGGANSTLLTVPSMGFRYLEVTFAVGTNVTSLNALWRQG
jgi:hypothetical protein